MEERLQYKPVVPLSRQEAERKFNSGDSREVIDALLSVTYHDSSWTYVHDWASHFLWRHRDSGVRAAAAQCLGLLAVFHKDPEIQAVIPTLQFFRHSPDPAVRREARSALLDVRNAFKKAPIARERCLLAGGEFDGY